MDLYGPAPWAKPFRTPVRTVRTTPDMLNISDDVNTIQVIGGQHTNLRTLEVHAQALLNTMMFCSNMQFCKSSMDIYKHCQQYSAGSLTWQHILMTCVIMPCMASLVSRFQHLTL